MRNDRPRPGEAVDAVPTGTRRVTGLKGEEAAARFLARSGYAIVDRNVRTRAGEIDLVARDGPTLVFVEVKTRRDMEGDPPQAAVNTRKQNRLGKLAQGYLKLKRVRQTPCRFDVVSVIFNDEGGVKAIRHIPNAFSVEPW
jgi:putative endonuclease